MRAAPLYTLVLDDLVWPARAWARRAAQRTPRRTIATRRWAPPLQGRAGQAVSTRRARLGAPAWTLPGAGVS
jgi:hypothetical protein